MCDFQKNPEILPLSVEQGANSSSDDELAWQNRQNKSFPKSVMMAWWWVSLTEQTEQAFLQNSDDGLMMS